IGVPCSSVPLAISTREPRMRSKRARTSAGTAKPATWPMCRGPLAYGHAGATRTVLSGTGNDQRNLPPHLVVQGAGDLGRSAANHLLMELGQLARQRQLPVRQHLIDEGERSANAKRRLECDRGPRAVDQRRQETAHLSWLAGQVAD